MKVLFFSVGICLASVGLILTIVSAIGFGIENHLELVNEQTACTVLTSTIYIDICTRSECDDDDCVYYDVDCWYASYVVSYNPYSTGSSSDNSTSLVGTVNSYKYYLYSDAVAQLNYYPAGSTNPCWYNTEDPSLVSFDRYDATGWRIFFIISLVVLGLGIVGLGIGVVMSIF
eukprot:TRINITY_DN2588_c0_g1_i1.p1 TRINITY_DN2588_c0_g1~~TRINITY_DN2588_c0_g1_i1.p1  ORF type:complete len:180 (+),score=24.63 TRINITY_DN2588_c0_g1_i1:23-541(+)